LLQSIGQLDFAYVYVKVNGTEINSFGTPKSLIYSRVGIAHQPNRSVTFIFSEFFYPTSKCVDDRLGGASAIPNDNDMIAVIDKTPVSIDQFLD
jgi:hypothetical protein